MKTCKLKNVGSGEYTKERMSDLELEVRGEQSIRPEFAHPLKAVFEQSIGQTLRDGAEFWYITTVNCIPDVQSSPITISAPATELSIFLEDTDLLPNTEQAHLALVKNPGESSELQTEYFVVVGRGSKGELPEKLSWIHVGTMRVEQEGLVFHPMIPGAPNSMVLPYGENGSVIVRTACQKKSITLESVGINEELAA